VRIEAGRAPDQLAVLTVTEVVDLVVIWALVNALAVWCFGHARRRD